MQLVFSNLTLLVCPSRLSSLSLTSFLTSCAVTASEGARAEQERTDTTGDGEEGLQLRIEMMDEELVAVEFRRVVV